MHQTTAELIERRVEGASQELRLRAPTLARGLMPGQPVLIKTGWDLQSYLRRAFYPITIDAESWTIRVVPSGDWGHAWLRAAPVGTMLDCLGPVGRGFGLPTAKRNLLCIGEGDQAWTLLPALEQADMKGMALTLAVQAVNERGLIPV
jgi:NAD(P)H-flavin reductase